MSATLTAYLWVALGSALGGVSRFWLFNLLAKSFPAFPVGTLVANVSGSFLIGLIASWSVGKSWGPFAHHFLMIGILGGFTTFSSFSLQTVNLAREGQWLYAGANAVLSFSLCLLAAWIGHLLGELIKR